MIDEQRRANCRETARAIGAGAGKIEAGRALIGLDGFVDEIIAVVDHRYDLDRFDRVPTITRMSEKIAGAAGKSTNYELVVTRRKLGGNGPIMANALATLGAPVTVVGSLGRPEVDPVFSELAARAEAISIAEPGFTNALEFSDGKLMLSKLESLREVDWANLKARLPVPELIERFRASRLIGLLNWSELPGLGAIWEALIAEVLPHVPRGDRTLFIDLVDPEKRTADDIRGATRTLSRFQENIDVALGLNLKEAGQVAGALGIESSDGDLERLAEAIRSRLGLDCVVIHPREGASAARRGESATMAGPFVARPLISTGAGDHFNAGFCLGLTLGLPLEGCLAAGVATSGFYVRTARSPNAEELAGFLDDLPGAEG